MLEIGTYRLTPQECYRSISHGLSQGLRRIDTAQLYQNEAAVGQALTDAQNDEPVFVTTKIHRRHMEAGRAQVLQSLEQSFERLCGHVDQVLLHVPLNNWRVTWDALQMDVTRDRVPYVGVSNFPLHLMEQLDPLPYSHQVELSPYCPRPRMVAWCLEHKVRVTAHSVLGKGALLTEPEVQKWAMAKDCTSVQALIGWTISQGCHPILRSSSTAHIDEWLTHPNMTGTPQIWSSNLRVVTHPQFPFEL